MSLLKSLFLFYVCIDFSFAKQLTVAVASNFIKPIKTITKSFDGKIRLVFGSSGKLYAQIINGAPYDLFLSADQIKPRILYDNGHTKFKPFTYAIGRLALFTSKNSLMPVDQNTLFKDISIAIANPVLAPYGEAAINVLDKILIGGKAHNKLIQGENISQVFSFVSSGNVDLGFVALSQVIEKAKYNFWIIPINYHQSIKQDAVILKTNDLCKRFVEYIQSEDVRLLLRSYGYLWN